MNPQSALSVIIITRNEELDIEACLESVKTIADEIVLVDSGSSDRTLEIARRYTHKIFSHEWAGFSKQKQVALEKAAGPWILNLDADERVSPELAVEIRELLGGGRGEKFNAYRIPFRHFFCGGRLRFGAGQRETHIRLYKKSLSRYGPQSVHEGILVTPPVGRLRNPIHHFSYRDLHDYLAKCNHYTTLIAKEKYAKGRRFHVWHHLRLPWEFAVRYVFKLGFLDGGRGLIYALLSSYYVWLKFVKLRDCEAEQS